MRKTLMFLLSFVLVFSAARGVSASTDCQRWLADYKKALAEKAGKPQLLAAKHRVRAYARRKVGQLTAVATPKPHPTTRIANTHPHLTPAQMLKRYEVLCGDLPVDPAPEVLDARMSPDEFVSEMAAAGPVETEGVPSEGSEIAENAPPVYETPAVNTVTPSTVPFGPTYGPVPGGYTPYVPVTPITPVAPVPEPGSWMLMLSGGAGLVSVMRRRLA